MHRNVRFQFKHIILLNEDRNEHLCGKKYLLSFCWTQELTLLKPLSVFGAKWARYFFRLQYPLDFLKVDPKLSKCHK